MQNSIANPLATHGTFSLKGINLFLTYPQCSIDPLIAQTTFKAKLKHYQWSIIAREAHDDGNPHLHCFVRLRKPCFLTSPTCLDLCGPGGVLCHGNYQVARDPKASLDYVVKDGNLVCDGTTLEDARAQFAVAGRKRTATELIMQELQAGKDIAEIDEKYPEHATFIMLHADKLQNLFTMKQLLKLRPPLSFSKAETKFPPTEWDSVICHWLNKNLLKDRMFSQKQLWIHGPTCHGKTTLKNTLKTCLRIYSVPNEDFYDDYKDTLYDLVIFDEYQPSQTKTIGWMNAFCDGSETPLRQKGKQTVKRKNLPLIVLSNFSPEMCYPKASVDHPAHFATLKRRFEVVELLAPMSVSVLTTGPQVQTETPTDTGTQVTDDQNNDVTDEELRELIPINLLN